jgi:hypothetical protein
VTLALTLMLALTLTLALAPTLALTLTLALAPTLALAAAAQGGRPVLARAGRSLRRFPAATRLRCRARVTSTLTA